MSVFLMWDPLEPSFIKEWIRRLLLGQTDYETKVGALWDSSPGSIRHETETWMILVL